MLILLSPAKTLDLSPQQQTQTFTEPQFPDDAQQLIKKLRGLSMKALGELMGISSDLARLNRDRYAEWSLPFTPQNAKQAVLTFDGEVYTGLAASSFRAADLKFAQSHLRILSGLYGVLRPLDLMQAYRLEMGTRLATRRGKDLYDFWGDRISQSINADLAQQKHRVLVNLASQEYFKAVRPQQVDGRVVAAVFREIKAGKSRTIATFAKQARGRMAAWIIRNRIVDPADLNQFDEAGYQYVAAESTADAIVFSRPQPPPPRKAQRPA